MLKNTKKGAIFGIDARIALAVFAMVSLVASYNSFFKIDDAQTASLITQVDTLRKAAMQNIADNDYDYKRDATNLNDNIFGLYDTSGSYGLNFGKNNHSYIKQVDASNVDGEGYIQTPTGVIKFDNKNLYASSDLTTFTKTDCSNTLKDCTYWVKLTNVPEEAFINLKDYFDGLTGLNYSSAIASLQTGIIVPANINAGKTHADVYLNVGER
tara:strand:+ start:92 stop:727 length:636 start_codon:yes stop_codon:yes gene_type:complete